MGYFEELPNISYPSLLPQSIYIEDKIEVKNFFRRAKLRSDVDQVLSLNDSPGIRCDVRRLLDLRDFMSHLAQRNLNRVCQLDG